MDGDETTNWSASSTGSTSNPYWLIVDLGTVFQVSDVVLKSRDTSTWSNDYYEHYNLFTAVTSGDWIYRASGTLIDDPVLFFNTIDLAGTGVRWLKFEVDGGKHWAHLYEMEVNAVPVPPSVLLLLPGLLGLGILRGRFQSNS